MTEYRVRAGGGGEGGTLPTLAAAVALAKPGDRITVEAGVYRETLRPPAGTAWQGEPGAIIDGGWKGGELGTGADDTKGVLIRAAGVTLRGFIIRNVPGQGVAISTGGHNFTMEHCEIAFCYHGGVAANGLGVPIKNTVIRHCHVHDIALSGRFKEVPVNGCFLFKSCDGVLVEDCLIERGHGEGMAAGSRSKNVTFRRVTVRDTKHLLMYVANRAQNVLVEDCVLYQTGIPEFTQQDGDAGAGLVVGDEESGAKDDNWQHSENVTIRRCVVWNAGGMFGLRNNAKPGKGGDDGYNTNIKNLTVKQCTFVTGPLSKGGIAISDNEYGAGKVAGVFEANVFLFDNMRDSGDGFKSNAPGVKFTGNAFSVMPPTLAADNVHMSAAGLVAPFATPFSVENLRPIAGGLIDLGRLGALSATGEPPVDPPPVDPPDDPPDEPEPPLQPVDWVALGGMVAEALAQVATAQLAAEDAGRGLTALAARIREYEQAA